MTSPKGQIVSLVSAVLKLFFGGHVRVSLLKVLDIFWGTPTAAQYRICSRANRYREQVIQSI
jgi:hypothetical protein